MEPRQTKQRWVDFGLSLPEGAPDALLRRELLSWSAGLKQKTMETRLSELRTLTHPDVRKHLPTIRRRAERLAANGEGRYKHLFMAACQRVRRRGRP